MSVHPRQKAGELFGVLSLASSLLLVLSLLSYSGLDPSISVSSPTQQYFNYVGKVGALVSDFLFQALGFSAFFLPLPLLLIGYKKIRSQTLEYPLTKFLGLCLIITAFSTGLSLLHVQVPEEVNFSSGGIFGLVTSYFVLKYFNELGSLVLMGTLLIISLMLSTRFSIYAILNWISNRNWSIFSTSAKRYTQWRTRKKKHKKPSRLNWGKNPSLSKSISTEVLSQEEIMQNQSEDQHKKPTVKLVAPNPPSPAKKSVESNVALQNTSHTQIVRPYKTPPTDFLQPPVEDTDVNEQELIERSQLMTTKCAEFGVHGRVLQIHPGPVVTTFEFKPDPGVKYSKITNLADDLCLALRAESVRIDRIPGKNTVGIEAPNLNSQTISIREILESAAFQQSNSPLTLGLGRLINGNTYITDLTKMPHLLIAGATGSGKSVALNCMVCSILYKASPQVVRFIMIDPKRLELGVYADIPHLLTPIVTDPKQAANALNWAVSEMEQRYKQLAQWGVRNIDQYNQLFSKEIEELQDEEPLPYIVLIIDELADLMMTAGKEVESSVTRLAQMARAVGIHLILATQRPSVDVLTGLIKANFPSRISFHVSSKIDSRTILDCNGAEQLLGHGDMLFLPPGTSRLVRIHGGYISEKEIRKITSFLKQQATPEYKKEVLASPAEKEPSLVDVANLEDALYDEAAKFVVETGRASTSLLQRRLRIGYGRAARLLDMMEHKGLVGPPEGSKAREVLISSEQFSDIDSD